MNSFLKKGISAMASAVVLINTAFCPSAFSAIAVQTESIILSLGKVCISPENLEQDGYKVTVPVKVFGATDGILSFDSIYIAFGNIDSGNYPLNISNVCAENSEVSVSRNDISSDAFEITSSFDFVEQEIDAFSISGYCSQEQTGDEITLCEIIVTLPETAQLGDVYNIVWYDALNDMISPDISAKTGDYEVEYSDGLVYIGAMDVRDESGYEDMYIADDVRSLGANVTIAINPDIQGHSVVDISDLVSFGFDGASNMDMTYAECGDAFVSPFDLYWSAYQSDVKSADFSGSLSVDETVFTTLCDRIGEAIGIEINPVADKDFFRNVLYEETGEKKSLGSYDFSVAHRGDVNLDCSADAKDAAAIAKYSALSATIAPGGELPTISSVNDELAKFVADTNNDGIIDAKDAANTAKFSSENSISSLDAPKAYYTIWSNILG